MMAMPDHETPEQEAARVRQALVREAEVLIAALRRVAVRGSYDAHWLRGLALRIQARGVSEAEREFLARLAWFHRRGIATHLAPKSDPDDPVVAEMTAARMRADG